MAPETENKKRMRPEVEEAMSLALADIDNTAASPVTKKAKTGDRRSLFVRSLPANVTNESLTEFFSEYFPVKHATVVVDQNTKESRGFGFVTLADADDAKEAQKVFDKKKWDGRFIRVDVAEPRQRGTAAEPKEPRPKPGKPVFEPTPKLIVRNLPWTIKTSDQLSALFRSYGKVKFADLPKNKGLLKGFGFVTLRGKKNAEKALEGINGKEIDGRTLAVDWAVDKNTWDMQQSKQAAEDAEDETSDDETSGEEDEDEDEDEGTKKEGIDADLENFMKNHMQNMEDEDDEDDEDDDKDEEEEEAKQKAASQRSTDNSTTVFVRNLPFTTTDEQLKTFFSHFGTIRYARVVMDKTTDRPAGTGFVCFANIDEAKECLRKAPRQQPTAATGKTSLLYDENADPTGQYTLDGRLLRVAQAVNKIEATDLAQNSLAVRREKDKRRLYLLAEGQIGNGTPMYNLLSETEIHMRQASVIQRKKLVQGNPSLHVSLARIALRNIPKSVGAKELKELARKAVVEFAKEVREGKRQPLSKEENARDGKDAREKDQERRNKGKGIVKQAKIIFENKQGTKVGESTGAGKSRGYGFIEYVSHHWALMGLRYLNGLQVDGDSGKKQRLIAEFSIENAQVVQRRRANEEKSRQPQSKDDGAEEGARPPQGDKKYGDRRNGKDSRRQEQRTLKQKTGGDGDEAEKMLKHKQIARTRLMRKKKANARSGKK